MSRQRLCVMMIGVLMLALMAGFGGNGRRGGMPAAAWGEAARASDRAGKGRKMIALERNETKVATAPAGGATTATLKIESPDFKAGQPIPEKFSHLGANISPELHWSGVPAGAKSLVLIVEDPDAPTPQPFVHWLVYNLPPDTKGLPQGMPAKGELDKPSGAMQGKSGMRQIGYMGPHPPQGAPHHYHFQIFALNEPLSLKPGADRDELVKAMSGHVLAKGETVGTFQVK